MQIKKKIMYSLDLKAYDLIMFLIYIQGIIKLSSNYSHEKEAVFDHKGRHRNLETGTVNFTKNDCKIIIIYYYPHILIYKLHMCYFLLCVCVCVLLAG